MATMKFIIRLARKTEDRGEVFRNVPISFKTTGISREMAWSQAAASAVYHLQKGERIVNIAEAGYHV